MKLYIYPTYTPSRDKSGNKYIKLFHNSFDRDGQFDVCNRMWKLGIASVFFNIDAKIFIVQWVDLIPYKRLGGIQFLTYLFAVWLLHILNRKIIWVLHNKHAHRGKSKLVDYGMDFIAKYADSVITHSKDGVNYFDARYPRLKGKCHYLPHPVYTYDIFESSDLRWDYIIWGGISRRKKVAEFLNFANRNAFFESKKILICGCCSDKEYDEEIRNSLWGNVTYLNGFVKDEDLKTLISQSKCILFTYNTESLLSSGALIYSINFCKPIIGPRSGNFEDLAEQGIVSCYDSFDDIPSLQPIDNKDAVLRFISENRWEQFPNKLLKIINLDKDNQKNV